MNKYKYDENITLQEKPNNWVCQILRMFSPKGLVLFLSLTMPQWAIAETLAEMLHEVRSTEVNVLGKNTEKMQSPDITNLKWAEKLFRRIFLGENSTELRQQWAGLGFELMEKTVETNSLLILRELSKTKKKYEGKGFFVFSVDRESTTVLQAPHSFHDAETEIIALELMATNNFRAAAWNTAPAELPVHSPLSPDFHAPPAKGYMLAFTRALMSVEVDSYVVQLHSFEKQNVYTPNAIHADIILSGYGEQSSQFIGWLGRCLKKELDYKVRVFPFEVQEMGAGEKIPGANYNAIGELMREKNNQGFVHLVMNAMFREDLRSYSLMQKKMTSCLNRE